MEVEEGVVEHLEVRHLFRRGLLQLHLDLLIWATALLSYEIFDGFDQADFVIQTAWTDNCWRHALRRLTDRVSESCAFLGVTILLLLFQTDSVDEALRGIL